MALRKPPSAAFEDAVTQVQDRLRLTDADLDLQRSFGQVYGTGDGRVVLDWLIEELTTPLYSLGAPFEVAVAFGARVEVAMLVKDLIRRGLAVLEAEAARR